MSRGKGARQREVLAAIDERTQQDEFTWRGRTLRARWRWYNLSRLSLIDPTTTRSRRVALNRAIHRLAEDGELELRDQYPYYWFLAPDHRGFALDDDGFTSEPDWSEWLEIQRLNPDSPRPGRSLWFRRPPDGDIPNDDQIAVLIRVDNYTYEDELEEFIYMRDRERAKHSEMGRLLHWLLHGSRSAA